MSGNLSDSRILIAGCGYIGIPLAERIIARGGEAFGLRRSADSLPNGIVPVSADLTAPATLGGMPENITAVVFALSANESSPEGYERAYLSAQKNLIDALRGQPISRYIFVSSTSVYGQDSGWVDEDSETAPQGFRGSIMREAEAVALDAPWSSTVVRFGGIYGPGRGRWIRKVNEAADGEVVGPDPPRYMNRIHRDDCAGFIEHLIEPPSPEEIYLGVDSAPESSSEFIGWLGDRLDKDIAVATTSEVVGKRCSNKKLIGSGYRLQHPDFRSGYGSMLESGDF